MFQRKHLYLGVTALGLGFAALPSPATAFPRLDFWHMPASGETNQKQNRAGAEGIYGTGGPFEYGIQCAHCHIDADGQIDLQFDVQPAFGQSGNDQTYVPGQRYDITVTMTGEHKGLSGMGGNVNGFSASFEDPGGAVMGTLYSDTPNNSSNNCPSQAPSNVPSGTTYVYGDCHAILFSGGDDVTQWVFQWEAPAAGAGDVTMWYGGVDGDTGGHNSLDDDVVQGSVLLREGN